MFTFLLFQIFQRGREWGLWMDVFTCVGGRFGVWCGGVWRGHGGLLDIFYRVVSDAGSDVAETNRSEIGVDVYMSSRRPDAEAVQWVLEFWA